MNLYRALRLDNSPCVAFVGAGGKTTALFKLARQLKSPVIVTATTHLGVNQVSLADSHWLVNKGGFPPGLEQELSGVMLVTGPVDGDRTTGVTRSTLQWLREIAGNHAIPLLIEADGSRQHPLKAPDVHEPVIPDFIDSVVVVAGLAGLGESLDEHHVHRPLIFSRLSGLPLGEKIDSGSLSKVLLHPDGGLKDIPPSARRVVLLNQADTPGLLAQSKTLAETLLIGYDAVIIASLVPPSVESAGLPLIYSVRERVAAIILAAGGAKRFGRPKQLLPWGSKPLIRHVAQVALRADLSPVVVVLGAAADQVRPALDDLPVVVCENPGWQEGQSSSLRTGLSALPAGMGAVIFLLVDQPLVQPSLLRALVERHSLDLSPVIAPLVQGERANPVLFDQTTFPSLKQLTGDVGGRGIFSQFPPVYLPWNDSGLLVDIDTPEEYENLVS